MFLAPRASPHPPDLWQFMLIFLLVILCIGAFAWMLFGEYMWEFRTFAWTLHTIGSANFGDVPDFDEMWRRDNFWGESLRTAQSKNAL